MSSEKRAGPCFLLHVVIVLGLVQRYLFATLLGFSLKGLIVLPHAIVGLQLVWICRRASACKCLHASEWLVAACLPPFSSGDCCGHLDSKSWPPVRVSSLVRFSLVELSLFFGDIVSAGVSALGVATATSSPARNSASANFEAFIQVLNSTQV